MANEQITFSKPQTLELSTKKDPSDITIGDIMKSALANLLKEHPPALLNDILIDWVEDQKKKIIGKKVGKFLDNEYPNVQDNGKLPELTKKQLKILFVKFIHEK